MGKSIVQTATIEKEAGFRVLDSMKFSGQLPVWGLFLCLSLSACSGERPKDLGVRDGQLKICPSSPNCVSTHPKEDADHFIQPLLFSAAPSAVIARVRRVVQSQERTRVIEENSRYLYAEFESKVLGFVDDVEFFVEAKTGTLHVRSASRLGESDLGVNRERVEKLFTLLKGTDKNPTP